MNHLDISTLSISPPPPPPAPPLPHTKPQTPLPISTPLQEFKYFPTLPLELRLKIYHLINHTPRTVTLSYKAIFHPPPPRSLYPNNAHLLNSPSPNQDPNPTDHIRNSPLVRNSPRAGARSRIQGIAAPSFTSRWASSTPPPVLLGVCHESRVEALRVYDVAFGSIEAPVASVFFGFGVDEVHFTGFGAYQLDLFLGGDYYGGTSKDITRVRSIRLDVPEELYGRRNFCWGDLRGFGPSLTNVVLVVREESSSAPSSTLSAASATGVVVSTKDRLMAYYRKSLKRVWDAYVHGEGEGNVAEGAQWKIPEIEVWNELGGKGGKGESWGRVALEDLEN